MEQMTVKELALLCIHEVEKGNGDKMIVVSDDNEGNGYHGLFFGFEEIPESQKDDFIVLLCDTQEKDITKLMLLG